MRGNRLLSLLVVLALLLGLVSPTLAAGNGSKGRFLDVPDDDWAFPYVLEMQAKGLMQGTGAGRFEPNAPLTRAQAVTVAIRLMGLESAAQNYGRINDMMLPFADRDKLPEWAEPYIAVAVEEDILPVAEDGLFRADEKATRLWVSVLLVRALGFDAEAQAKMTESLPFRDGYLIPASLVGYVATAVDHELIQGFPNGTFQPNDALTRAQAAALLSRTDSQLIDLGRLRPGLLAGDLLSTDTRAYTVTMLVQGRERVVSIDRQAPIFLDERPVSLNQLPVGARLSVVVDQRGTALMIMARKPVVETDQNLVRGRVNSLIQAKEMAGGLGLVVIETTQGRERSYPLAPELKVTYQGKSLALGEIRVGDEVNLKVVAGVAIGIDVLKRGTEQGPNVVKGQITAIRPGTTNALATIEMKNGTRTSSIKVAPGVTVTSGNTRIQLSDLKVGDEVSITVAQGVGIRIVLDQPVRKEETVKGTIQTIYPATKTAKARLTVKTDKGSRTVTLADTVSIRLGNTRLKLEDLRKDDEVTITLVNGVAEQIRVEDRGPLVEEIKGEIQTVYDVSINFTSSIVVKLEKGTKTIVLAPDVRITHGSNRLKVEDLRAGDKVTVTVVDGKATTIKVEQRGPLVEEVEGLIQKINPSTRTTKASLVIKTDKTTKTIPLAADVVITHERTKLRLDQLKLGDLVVIKVVDGTGTEVKVEEPAPKVEEIEGLIEAVYSVSIDFKSRIAIKTASGSRTIVLAPDATISFGKTQLELEDLLVGDKIKIKLVDNVGTQVTMVERVQAVVKGQVTGVYEVSINFEPTLEIKTDKSVQSISLSPDLLITRGRTKLKLGDLQVGDWVEVKLVANKAVEIKVDETIRTVEIEGSIVGIWERQITIRTKDGRERTLTLAQNAALSYKGRSIKLEQLYTGDQVTLRIQGDQIQRLTITDRLNP